MIAPLVIQVRIASRVLSGRRPLPKGMEEPQVVVHWPVKVPWVLSSLCMSQLLVGSPGSTRSMVGSSVLTTFTRDAWAVPQLAKPPRPPELPWQPEQTG